VTVTDHRREIRDAYDVIAADHDERRDRDTAELSLVDDLLESLPSDPTILDAGCGAGEPITTHLDARASVVGLDFSTGQLRLARDRLSSQTPLVQGDMTALPFGADRFDAVTSIYAVIHVPSERHRAVFAEFARVLRPSGRFLVTVGETDWSGTNENWLGFGATMHWDMPGVDRAETLLSEVGFTVTDRTSILDDFGEESGYKTFLTAELR
jgi:ubiquinone/menaquinone biosynthesis C-methylase UbiE